ncbi:MAG: indolepyruvate oxidoreductase subunit beta [Clostridia bacterium]|nr:indolepyruvate oxidoreductase subunit beta [Clostridia bacterium]MDH7572594.1 indolepyruvate oxidoreductase subunit beta [Clostridia bacterium]
MKGFNLVIAGVGGQGNVLACQIIGMAAVEEGWQVSAADTFGVSQRGGAVMSHLRLAQGRPCGPLIGAGEADILVGLEPMEAVRVLKRFGNRHTRVLVNTRPNYPLAVLSGTARYPAVSELLAAMCANCAAVVEVPADRLAAEAGSLLTQNVVMTGALAGSGWLPLGLASFEKVLRSLFTGAVLESNLRAFHLGVAATRECRQWAAAGG